jgi:endoglucanase
MFGVANEPKSNFNGSRDRNAWSAMNDVVAAIRAVEDGAGTPRHIVAVQGTRQWARILDYYVTHPIEAGNGENVVYETHVYDHAADFDSRFGIPSRTLPVIIGEFGPAGGGATMSMDDCARLMNRGDELGVPYLAWIFHMRCPPNLLMDSSNGGCGVDMPLTPSEWGRLVRDHLSSFK